MAGMSVDGLISGLDTTSLVAQLVQAEGAPKAQLQTRLTTTEAAATAYRQVNTRFDAVRTAAESLTKPELWSTAKATSSSSGVTVTVGTQPQVGSLTFSVTGIAAAHSLVTTGTPLPNTTDPAGFGSSLQIRNKDGSDRGPAIPIGGNGSLTEVVKAINASDKGLTAAAVQVGPGRFQLQVTAKDSGAANEFSLGGHTLGIATQGTDAALKVGTGPGAYTVTSGTNTFADLMPGVTLAVSKLETGVTVGVSSDPDAVAAKVKSLVDTVNGALNSIKTYSAAKGGPVAVLKGDSSLMNLSSQLLTGMSDAVGADGSPWTVGLRLEKDGTVLFDQTRFTAALKADPALAQRMIAGRAAGVGPDGVSGGTDDVPAVTGVAQRLFDVARSASDATTGRLTQLAKGRDDLAKDIQKRIDAWDLRLVHRRETLTRQFTAMETALSSMKNQSNWLAGQLASLPSSS